MSEQRKPYPFDIFEPKWQQFWDENKTYQTLGPGDEGFDASKPKYFVLDMFPYPSGAGLHVGHPEGYTATDIMGRYKRMNGFNVLHPMGWDAFGLPAEQYAIKTGQHPRVTTEANVENFRRQLKALGFAYDWDREVNTTDPEYVKWTQWIFIQLYNAYFDEEAQKAKPVSELEAKGWTKAQIDDVRLAYISEAPVNWSPDMGTVLANEEVEEWVSKGFTVERRPLRQWMLRITKYADRLIDELEPLDWPESIKMLQRNWIGKSEGAELTFQIQGSDQSVEIYTTRPDTLFGATYMVIAPEHPLVSEITTEENKEKVEAYVAGCATKSDRDRQESKEKTGEPTGAFAVNPVNGEAIPIWISDYVMMDYGSGAIMAVPGHDERDFAFAKAFGLDIKRVVKGKKDADDAALGEAFTDHGVACNSGFLDGYKTKAAKAKMIDWIEEEGLGKRKTNFKLRDWLFSRQRYWGEPFPIVWGEEGHEAIPESELPLLQPEMEDFKPTGDPRGPLVKATDWIEYSETAQRETNTMPQWAGSCWYYLRYADPKNTERFISKEAEDYWLKGSGENAGGVDLYVGGTEHAVLHLLYARFWHKILFDLGHLNTVEPFQKLVNQGLILAEDGRKMSKSLGNVVNPDDVVNDYGADALRLYEMFMGPLEQTKPWSTKGVDGVARFLGRVWRLAFKQNQEGVWELSDKLAEGAAEDKKIRKVVHETVKKVGEDIERMAFNTGISQMMVCTNELTSADQVHVDDLVKLLQVLNPYAPHLTEEVYAGLKQRFESLSDELLSEQGWPDFVAEYLVDDEIELAVQVNGKLRAKLMVAPDAAKDVIEAAAMETEQVQKFIEGKTVRKVIVVPKRLVNIVAN